MFESPCPIVLLGDPDKVAPALHVAELIDPAEGEPGAAGVFLRI